MRIQCTSGNSNVQGLRIHNNPNISWTVTATKREHDLFCFVGTAIFVHELISHETVREGADEYWKRNKEASLIVQHVIAEHLGRNCDEWIEHLNDSARHLEWINTTFGLTLTEADFKRAWQLFKHRSWFDRCASERGGYYIRGWLAVAEALKIGEKARRKLQEGEYPHAHRYEGQIKCLRGSDCPICANREYLESLGELKPKVTGNERIDEMLAMNFDYWSGQPLWVRNWLLLHNEFIVKHTPKCSKCGEIIRPGRIFGCDSWVKRIKKGICYDCDGQYQAEVRRLEREYSKPRRLRRIKQHDHYSLGSAQKGLEDFMKAR